LIPALNEEDALPIVLRAIPDTVGRVIVVDNGSTDNTAEVARAHGAEVVHERHRGYGAACLAGIRHLAEEGERPDLLVFLDADGSDDPAGIPTLVAPILKGDADLVLGVGRGVGGDVGTILPHARFGNRLMLGLMAALFGKRYQDMPPFRAIRFTSLHRLVMDDLNWGWTMQMQIRAVKQQLCIVEIEMPHRRRLEGESKISGSLTGSLKVGAKMFYTLGREKMKG